MPEGPLGAPRPLATGDVVILVTVKHDAQWDLFDPNILKNDLEVDGWNVKDVNLDRSDRTYAVNTGLDVMELDNLNSLAEDAEENVKQLLGSNSVMGIQVGFQ